MLRSRARRPARRARRRVSWRLSSGLGPRGGACIGCYAGLRALPTRMPTAVRRDVMRCTRVSRRGPYDRLQQRPTKAKAMRSRLALLLTLLLLPAAVIASQPFRIGNSGPSSGPNSASMLELLDGARLYFDSINDAGGIKGRRIEFLQRDDNFEVPRTVANVGK